MPLAWRRALRVGKRSRLNLSKSGASLSHRRGPVTINSRRRGSIRLPFGLSYRFKLRQGREEALTFEVGASLPVSARPGENVPSFGRHCHPQLSATPSTRRRILVSATLTTPR
jgi:hypothetical protein